jgi:hypothetical protein
MTFSEALELAQKLNADPEDDWGYVAVIRPGLEDNASLACYDDKGNLMGYLKGNWRLYHG